jgi:exopolysaccharide biosynthesis polyprenyl glycosylphosphotransferase
MSRKRLPIWRTLLVMTCDALAIGVGLFGAYWLRFDSPLTTLLPVEKGYDPAWYLRVLPLAWLVWLAALRLENLYRRRASAFDFSVVRRVVTGSCLALLLLIAWNFYWRGGPEYSRLVTALMLVTCVAMLLAGRVALHFLFRWLLVNRRVGQSRVAIVGEGPLASSLWRALHARPELGMVPVGLILPLRSAPGDAETMTIAPPDAEAPKFPFSGAPVLGRAENLKDVLVAHRVDEVIFVKPTSDRASLMEMLLACEQAMAVFRVVPAVNDLLMSGMVVESIEGIPLLGVRETPLQGWNAALKRLIDVVAAGLGLMLTGPPIAVLAWLVWRHDRRNPFYWQERMGIDGRLFRIVKLRTMRPDAEHATGPTFADERDSRVTPPGAILRRTHLDELPQLWNVLRGDMSLVGPRPERPCFIEQFREDMPHYMARHKVRSGMTGWAQINGLCGHHGSIADRLSYDLYYIEHWSLWLDVKILMMTLFGQQKPGTAGR